MAVKVKILKKGFVGDPEKLEAAKLAVQKLADAHDAEVEITTRDDDGNPIARLVATPSR